MRRVSRIAGVGFVAAAIFFVGFGLARAATRHEHGPRCWQSSSASYVGGVEIVWTDQKRCQP